ncbi:SCO family protein [Membranihabitans maritimus]|uniref:SCO family protein n=1 Tax=Membranihabitans maritimus TaxID=2904244 RepID=UPI001F284023|nr:SCO family protein [Membranihabitans maritimus]
MRTFSIQLSVILLLSLVFGCQDANDKALPIMGIPTITESGDTIQHSIPDYTFIDQDSNQVTPATFSGKAYVADFFFTSCPSICPIMTKEMKRIYDSFDEDDRLMFLSHSIDTRHDSVPVLKEYANKLNIDHNRWRFVTGEKSEIYDIANAYFNIAYEDPDAPGGYDHSGKLILVDANRHVRAYCEGTDHESVTKFIEDIEILLHEKDLAASPSN